MKYYYYITAEMILTQRYFTNLNLIVKPLRGFIMSSMLSAFFISAAGQTTNYSFTNYTTAQGLPNNKIYSLTQDSRGFLWIGTIEGLSRFDGKNFKNFYSEKDDSIVKGNYFNDIYEYKKGHLVLTNGTRTICFNTYTEKFYPCPVTGMEYLGITQSINKEKYYAAGIDKAYFLNNKLQITDSVKKPPALPDAHSWLKPYYFNRDNILLEYFGDFYLYDVAQRKYEHIPTDFGLLDIAFITTFKYYDSLKQEIYFAEYHNGLYRYSLLTKKTEHLLVSANNLRYSSGHVAAIIPKNTQELWVLCEWGIHILETKTNTITIVKTSVKKNNYSINNETNSCFFDTNGNTWVGTANGLFKLNANTFKIKTWENEFNKNPGWELMSIVKGPDGNMYPSVYGGGAYTLNTNTNTVVSWKHPLNYSNWYLFVRGDEIIRTGGSNLLLSFNTKTKLFKTLDFLKPFYPDIELITMGFLHSNGDEWYCANHGGGFVRKLAASNIYKTYKKNDGINNFSNGYYSCYAEDQHGDLWFGVNKSNKLLHWVYKKDKFIDIDFKTIKGTENIDLTGINDVACDSECNIWIGFDGRGLIKYNPLTNTAIHYSITEGLPTNYIVGLQFDNKNRLWLNTLNGLCCFMIKENKFINFKKEDGLPDDHFVEACQYYDSATNRLWVAAGGTLMCLDPDELLSTSRQSFPLYVDEIYLNSKRYTDTLQNNLSLKPTQNNIQFHFVAVDLNNGKDIEYSYLLQGADKDWNFSGNNQSASYANLKPGKYTFKVRARLKGETEWIEIKEPLYFMIATPWKESWWFMLLVLATIGVVVWVIIRSYYIRKIEKQNAVIEKQLAVSSERSRIAADMHDDMGSGLSRMRYLSAAIKNEVQDEGLRHDLDKLITGSDELVDKMNEIIWTLNSSDETLADVLYYIRSQCSEMLDNAGIHFEYSLPATVPATIITSEQKRNLYLVVKEAVHNTIKHSKASSVKLSVQIDEQLIISVSDNGVGFNTAVHKPNGNGLANYKKRMLLLNGTVTVQSGAEGTMVIFQLPIL